MRVLRFHLLDILILLLLSIVLLSFFTFFVPQPLSDPSAQSAAVTVPRGLSVRRIGVLLQQKGIVPRVGSFVLTVKVLGKEGALQAGRYSFPTQNSLISVVKQLSQGRVHAVPVTIPEGLTVHETAHRFKQYAAVDSLAFLRLTRDGGFIRSLNIETDHLEGYLFPNTYMAHWEMDSREVIGMMVDGFQGVFPKASVDRAKELGMSVREIVTLASIIEREVRVPEERPIISAVFHNRLKLGRALESCATVEYVLGVHKPRLTDEDLQIQSPYNTYLHTGLPPGPICSPGEAAIDAALHPADVDYLYFVSEGNGRHIFNRSLEEHVKAKHRIRREAKRRENGGN